MRRMYLSVFAVVAVMGLGLTACGDDDKEEAGTVDVTLTDFAIELGATSAPAGKVTFAVHNDGPSVHEFVVFKTDLALDALPTDENGDVAEGEEFEPVDEIEDIAVGADPTLPLDLEAGAYVVLCNVSGHFRQGMVAGFTVT